MAKNVLRFTCASDGGFLTLRRMCSSVATDSSHHRLVIIGAGAGGSTACNHFAGKLPKGQVAVVEPSPHHYYQPGFTLVGAGLKQLPWTRHATERHLHKKAVWLRAGVQSFQPDENAVTLDDGRRVKYDVLLIAMGVQLRFDLVKHLPAALDSRPNVLSNYSPKYVTKTFPAFTAFQPGGTAIFTHPDTPVKCAGAPQKAAYLFQSHLAKQKKHSADTKILFNTALPVVFGVPKYAEALQPVLRRKRITLNTRHVLRELDPNEDRALFHVLDENGKVVEEKKYGASTMELFHDYTYGTQSESPPTLQFDLLHVGAPCSAPAPLRAMAEKRSPLVDQSGFVAVHKHTLKHDTYPNVFAIGDCTALPNAKTAAAVAAQWGVVCKLVDATLNGRSVDAITDTYNGYGSCPLITDYGRTILAEFGYDGKVLETFPIDMGKERYTSWLMKTQLMAPLYWKLMVDMSMWTGPAMYRKIFRLGMSG